MVVTGNFHAECLFHPLFAIVAVIAGHHMVFVAQFQPKSSVITLSRSATILTPSPLVSVVAITPRAYIEAVIIVEDKSGNGSTVALDTSTDL